jgi:hypothetical protein
VINGPLVVPTGRYSNSRDEVVANLHRLIERWGSRDKSLRRLDRIAAGLGDLFGEQHAVVPSVRE